MTCRRFNPIHANASVDDLMVKRIITGLRACSLPKPEWTHGAHLTAGAALIDAFGLAGAEARMPEMIRRYNEATGVQNTDNEGYHHTITLFYLRQIEKFLAPFREETLPVRVTRLLVSPLAASDCPLAYYSRTVLFSPQARREWVAPDLGSIDD